MPKTTVHGGASYEGEPREAPEYVQVLYKGREWTVDRSALRNPRDEADAEFFEQRKQDSGKFDGEVLEMDGPPGPGTQEPGSDLPPVSEPYEKWNRARLRAEVERRNELRKAAGVEPFPEFRTKAEAIAALEQDDAEGQKPE